MDYWDDSDDWDDDFDGDEYNGDDDDDFEGFSNGANPYNPFTPNFGDFNSYFDDNNRFKFESLGEPDEKNPFVKDGVAYTEYKWYTAGGVTIRYVGIDKLSKDDLSDGMIKSDSLSNKDLNALYDSNNPIPYNFLRLLSASAEHNEKMYEDKFQTPEERLITLEEELEMAITVEDYEGAALIKDELVQLKKTLK